MYPTECAVVRAASLEEAGALLAEHPGGELIAGGQSLVPLMKTRLAAPEVVIDIGHLAPSDPIEVEDGAATIHALATHAAIGNDDRVTDALDLVGDVVPQIADTQVRNMGTIGGSLAEADPGNDWGPVVMAAGGVVHTRSADGTRSVPADDFIRDPFTTALAADEVIEAVELPFPPDRTGSVYLKAKRRQGGYGVASVAVQVGLDADGACGAVTVAVADDVSAYVRPTEAEAALLGHRPDADRIARAAAAVEAAVDPISDTSGTAAYKRNLCGRLFEHAVDVAVRRARGEPAAVDPMYGKGVVA